MRERIRTALNFLKDGQSFTVGELRLAVEGPKLISVTGWSQLKSFENLNKQRCLDELEEIKGLFHKMMESSQELEGFMKNKSVQFILCFDDYGKVSIGLCSEMNGKVKWEVDLK